MEYKDKKYILKKLMQDALTEEERIALQSSRRVTKEMERQWNNAPDAVESDRPDEPLSGGIFVRKSGNMMKDGMLYFIRYIVWSPPSYWYWVWQGLFILRCRTRRMSQCML